jgi:hypothetical protein
MAEERKNGIFGDLDEFDNGTLWSIEEIDALLRGEIVHPEEPPAQNEEQEPPAEKEEQELPAEQETQEQPAVIAAEQEQAEQTEQIGFEGMDATVSDEEKPAEEETEQEPEPGENQISIEKTRVFNEVDTSVRHNERIEHNITDQRVVHTTTAEQDNIVSRSNRMESDKIRERFINPPVKDIEKTAEHKAIIDALPPKTVERAGFFVEEGQKSATGGLDPLPTIVSIETKKGKPEVSEPREEVDDNQIVFEGFNENEEEIEKVDEYEAETELLRRRKEKARDFRLLQSLSEGDDELSDKKPEETDDDSDMKIIGAREETQTDEQQGDEESKITFDYTPTEKKRQPEPEIIEREYYGVKDRRAVAELLGKKRTSAFIKTVAAAGAFVILAVMSIMASNGDFSVFAGSSTVYLAVNMAVIAVISVVCFDTFIKGAKGLFRRIPNTDSAVFAALTAAIIQNAALIPFADAVETRVHIYSATAVFVLLLNCMGRFIKLKNIDENFSYVSSDGDFYSVRRIDNEDASFEIGRGLFLGDPDIRYNAMTGFESNYVENSLRGEPAAYTVIRAVPISVIIAFIIGVITFVVTRDAASAVTALAGTVCLASPAAALLSSAVIYSVITRKLDADDSMIVSYGCAQEATKANAVVFDAAELFDEAGCRSYGFKIFNSMRHDEAMLYTSAVIIAAGGPLSKVFRMSVIGDRDIFPIVENLNYEDRLGCSAWVEHNKRVLVGNRDLLINHNVEVLDKEEEQELKKDGRQIIYLAVEHVLSAVYVVSYTPNEEMAAQLRRLEKNSIPILIRTTDPNITEDFIEEKFGLPKNSVKIISSVAGDMFSEIYEEISEKDDSGLLHNGSPKSFLRVFNAAFTLISRFQIASVLQYLGVGFGVCIMALMSFFSALTQGGAIQLVLFMIIWSVVTILVPHIKR